MILKHPLPKPQNLQAIEKYKDREVYVYSSQLNMWFNFEKRSWVDKKYRTKDTFKNSLKTTKDASKERQIEYHFIDIIGENAPKITDFDQEEVYNCPTVKFDEYKNEGGKL